MSGRRWGALLLVVAGLLDVAGCGSGGQAPASPREELRAAVEKTLHADSFHFEGTGRMEGDIDVPPGAQSFEGIYNVPGRYRLRYTGGTTEMIEVDRVMYEMVTSEGGPPGTMATFDEDGNLVDLEGKYVRRPLPDGMKTFSGNLVVGPLREIQQATEVRRDRDDFVATANQGSYRVSVDDGFVTRVIHEVVVDENAVALTLRFSRYNSADLVAAPPDEQVVDPPDQAADDDGDSGASEPVELPHPTPGAKTTLQFRGVSALSEGECPPAMTNPPRDEPARLGDGDGACYELAPAGVEVVEVEDIEARRRGDDVELGMTFGERDAEDFDRLADANFQKQIAIVAFGRVLTAPVVQQREFNGEATVSGLTEQEAADLEAALTAR